MQDAGSLVRSTLVEPRPRTCQVLAIDEHGEPDDQRVTPGRDGEHTDRQGEIRDLASLAALDRQVPHLGRTCAVGNEIQGPAIGRPARRRGIGHDAGHAQGLRRTVGRHQPNAVDAPVALHVGLPQGIGDQPAVGRHLRISDAREAHQVVDVEGSRLACQSTRMESHCHHRADPYKLSHVFPITLCFIEFYSLIRTPRRRTQNAASLPAVPRRARGCQPPASAPQTCSSRRSRPQL